MFVHHLRIDDQHSRLTNRLRTMMTMILCGALLVAAAGPVQAMVVCVGANGHVDVELALGGCCLTPQIQETSTRLHVDTASHGCTGCTDHRLSTPLASNNSQRLRQLRPCFNEVPASATMNLSCISFTTQQEYSTSPPPPTLDLLATIILLV